MLRFPKIDPIGASLNGDLIQHIHIRKSDARPAEFCEVELTGYPGTYRIGKTYFDHQGHRCVGVTRLR
ncbi:hypothetical protein [Deinococcus koreensis]|uniref:Uncharacterized protein n=1 Tax=Deinococcus koreensis TaxID=2054903 RepID=A0A2K3USI5_9DEIO|nr:hypothetical protein [Deinococcus koreensis]PNY79502.1 hypothetical protein CVO96_18905 [Deinococcus koreensis]